MRIVWFLVAAAALAVAPRSADASRLITLNNTCVQIAVDFPLHVAVGFGASLTTEVCEKGNLVQVWDNRQIDNDIAISTRIQSNGADLCIDVPDAKPADNKKLQMYGCNQTKAQRWRIIPDVDSGTLRFASGLTDGDRWCISAADSTGFTAALVLRPCSDTDKNQKFYLQ